ncbi:N-acetyltransferase 9-like protein [Tetrabaena socialis]|uniref:N-acetyltransferase 9-like protein n=1 Tax=Tetrabaena socialis TaxID=47790 RepID=A0A2J8AIT0_9CHLO|nr:N-acetyltransferase 9-like protein [Tetrabaena socialis]|eukprot:PNH12418.1 N-acetyltransferase 9-like protein [Tetrabaena socialis]
MRVNSNTAIQGLVALLVPYRREHVTQYHEWMQDPALQEATASEPLSVEEEYRMQQSWAEDDDKLTFIVLDRSLPDTPGTGAHGGAMAGDVNLFFTLDEEEGGREAAEVEVMIAAKDSRGKGLAKEALRLLMAYASRELGVKRYVAKIHEVNAESRRLFEGLGFKEFKRVAVFGEVHYERHWTEQEAGQGSLQLMAYDS